MSSVVLRSQKIQANKKCCWSRFLRVWQSWPEVFPPQGGALTPSPAPRGFSWCAENWFFFATAFLSLGISFELSFLLPTYFLLPKVQSVNIPDLHALLDVDDELKHWIGRVSVQCDSINPESFGKWDKRPQEWIWMLVINEQSQGAFILLMAVLWVKAVCIWQFYYLLLFILLFLVHEVS